MNGVVHTAQAETETLIGTSRLTKILVDETMGVHGASVSLVTMPPGGETEKHRKEVTEIYYVVEGCMTIETEGGPVTFKKGEAGASLPGTLHSHHNTGDSWNQFCQEEPKFPQVWESKIPHPIHASASSVRTRPAFNFSLSRYELPRMFSVTA
jgi:quercetin dioxygenase-like cupin family protein